MRHRHSRLRLRQKPAHARVLKRNLLTSIILYERIRTTKKRAEVIQPLIDQLITIAKTKTPHVAVRAMNQMLTDKNASRKVMQVLVKRYADRASGLSRIVPVGSRIGDGAKVVDFMLLEGIPQESSKVEKSKVPASAEATAGRQSPKSKTSKKAK